ncbi:MAG TPA: hypothetical protein VIG25_23305 [Pyrinomonadaceae bacterium]|jgi:hypothetical protein
MSGRLAGKVWASGLAAHLKPLAAAMADIANDDGMSLYPSVAYLGWLLSKVSRLTPARWRSAFCGLSLCSTARLISGGVENFLVHRSPPRISPPSVFGRGIMQLPARLALNPKARFDSRSHPDLN